MSTFKLQGEVCRRMEGNLWIEEWPTGKLRWITRLASEQVKDYLQQEWCGFKYSSSSSALPEKFAEWRDVLVEEE